MSRVSRDLFLMSVYDKNAGLLGWAAKGLAKVGKSAWGGIKNWASKGIAKEGEAWAKSQRSQVMKNFSLTPKGTAAPLAKPPFQQPQGGSNIFKTLSNASDPAAIHRHGVMNWAGKTALKGGMLVGGTASVGKGLFGEKGLVTSPGNTYGSYQQRRPGPNQGFSNLSNGQQS